MSASAKIAAMALGEAAAGNHKAGLRKLKKQCQWHLNMRRKLAIGVKKWRCNRYQRLAIGEEKRNESRKRRKSQ